MLTNYLKIAYRNLLKNKVFSLINILGLAIGMAACLLILQYVRFELSYDDFHEKADRIYRVSSVNQQDVADARLLLPPPLGPELQENLPEVTNVTRLILPWSGQAASSTLGWNNSEGREIKQSFQWGFFVDPGFLEMFSFPLMYGDRQEALKGTHKIVLSERAARKLFGNTWQNQEQVIGQTLEYINEFDRFSFVVTGIIADAPVNSHLQYDFLASFATLATGWGKEVIARWDGNGVYTYLQLAPTTDVGALPQKIHQFVAGHGPRALAAHTDFRLQPLRDIYLHSRLENELNVNGNAIYVSFLALIAVLVLLVALLNYINLTTAQAIARGQEVGLRKVMGAARTQLIKQFLLESLLINTLAFTVAITLLQAVMPYYTSLTGKALVYPSTETWGFILFFFPVSTLLSGLYPAFVLSGYRPMQALCGKLVHSSRGKQLRQGMVVFQFWVSIILITFTGVVIRQLQHMQSSDPGFNQEGIVVVKGPVHRTETWIEHDRRKRDQAEGDAFKDALAQQAGIEAASLSWSIPGERSSIFAIELGEAYHHRSIDVLIADSDYAAVYGLEVLAGHFDTDQGHVINEQAAALLGYQNPVAAVGQVFRDDQDFERQIVGVVRDYHHHSLHHEIRPLLFAKNDPTYTLDSYYSIQVVANDLDASLAHIRAAYQEVYPYDPFDYYFIDAYFAAQYQQEKRWGKLFGLTAILTIFIACLGMFGLSSYLSTQRTKEIGIRKVLGASVRTVVALLARDFIKLVLIASALAIPVALWGTSVWLDNYAFRIAITGWLLLLPVLMVILIALLTVGTQTIRAALANPVESLRYE